MPASAEIDPGCGLLFICWKLYPDFQSHKFNVPLSEPLTKTLSLFNARQFTTESAPETFLKKMPSGHFQTLMLSAAPEQNVYSW